MARKYAWNIIFLVVVLMSLIIGFSAESIENAGNAVFFIWILVFAVVLCALLGFLYAFHINITDYASGIPNITGLAVYSVWLRITKRFDHFSCFYLNIKNFKYVNETVSNGGGNYVLKIFSQAVKGKLARGEIICRLGGDNFALLIKKGREQQFIDSIKDIKVTYNHDDVKKSFIMNSRMGIYAIKKGDDINVALNSSSTAYHYTRQASLKDYVWFEKAMQEQSFNEKEVLVTFSPALQNHEFHVYYQPKYNMKTGDMIGAEALVRWIQNDKIVCPDDFVPILEKEGSIAHLDFFIFEKVCQDIKLWLIDGVEPPRISINFSRIHIQDNQFAKRILSIISEYEIDSKFIEIEITESASYKDFAALKKFVECMSENGISVSIDDFGTGYSSLSLLTNLPVDVVKLDKSFIQNFEEDRLRNFELLRNLINMIKGFNCQVICEGVETKEQKDFLLEVGCYLAQGFYYSKPVVHEEFEHLIVSSHVTMLATAIRDTPVTPEINV